jgi:hypothetical protein
MTLKEELAKIRLQKAVSRTSVYPEWHIHPDDVTQIIKAFNKIVPVKKPMTDLDCDCDGSGKDSDGYCNCEYSNNEGHNQCVDQIEKAINE